MFIEFIVAKAQNKTTKVTLPARGDHPYLSQSPPFYTYQRMTSSRRHRGFVTNDKMLIKILLLAAFLSALSIVLVPLDIIEDGSAPVHHYVRPSPPKLDIRRWKRIARNFLEKKKNGSLAVDESPESLEEMKRAKAVMEKQMDTHGIHASPEVLELGWELAQEFLKNQKELDEQEKEKLRRSHGVNASPEILELGWELAQDFLKKQQQEQQTESSQNKQNESNENTTMKKRDSTYEQPPVKYHTVFSTGCSTFQDWQSYVFFYHALQSKQEGHITRIASGCEGETKETLDRIFKDEIASMDPERLHLHQTPEFGNVGGLKKAFKYYNKPFGMRHWMENVLGYPENHAEHDDSIVILLDPDQILLRPFTNDFTNSSEIYRLKNKDQHKFKVEHGSPFAAQYGYGIQWLDKVDPALTFNDPNTPVATMDRKEAKDYFAAMGPPYVATAKDMYAIVKTWSEIVPSVHEQYPHLLAEMFAFNLAAAHLKLRHTLTYSFMVSDVTAGGEGWPLIDKVPEKDVCAHFPKTEYVSDTVVIQFYPYALTFASNQTELFFLFDSLMSFIIAKDIFLENGLLESTDYERILSLVKHPS